MTLLAPRRIGFEGLGMTQSMCILDLSFHDSDLLLIKCFGEQYQKFFVSVRTCSPFFAVRQDSTGVVIVSNYTSVLLKSRLFTTNENKVVEIKGFSKDGIILLLSF